MEYSGAGGKLIHEKNQKQKISWHCPFNWLCKKWIELAYVTLSVLLALCCIALDITCNICLHVKQCYLLCTLTVLLICYSIKRQAIGKSSILRQHKLNFLLINFLKRGWRTSGYWIDAQNVVMLDKTQTVKELKTQQTDKPCKHLFHGNKTSTWFFIKVLFD